MDQKTFDDIASSVRGPLEEKLGEHKNAESYSSPGGDPQRPTRMAQISTYATLMDNILGKVAEVEGLNYTPFGEPRKVNVTMTIDPLASVRDYKK